MTSESADSVEDSPVRDYRARGSVDTGPRGGVWVAYDEDQTVPCASYDDATRLRMRAVFVPFGTRIGDAIEAEERA
jgi:hypothetical protein